MKQTFEELLSSIDKWTQYGPNYEGKDIIKLLKQVRLSTLQECQKKVQLESRIYNLEGEYKSDLLGEEILLDQDEPWYYIGINTKELLNLDLNSIEIDE